MTAPLRIRAAVFWDETGRPTIESLDLSGPGPGEVLVRIVATGVCHTDHKAAGPGPSPKPVVLGHEGAGVVVGVGAGVSKLAAGDHVVMTFGSCGGCRSCDAAQPAYCHDGFNYCFTCRPPGARSYLMSPRGAVNGYFFCQSSFATHAIGLERSVVKIPNDVPLEIMGPLGCGVQTGAGAVLNDFNLQPDQSFAVFGVGALGLSAVMAARIVGARQIIAIDRHQHRLDLSRELGAHVGILAGDASLAAQIMELCPGGVDVALDTTGSLSVMRQAIDCLAPRGEAGFVASPWDGSELPIDIRRLLQGRRIRGIIEGDSNPDLFIPRLVEYWRRGLFPFERLIRFYEFDEIEKAFHDSEAGLTVKPVLRIRQ
jgi:aryl-alcohol dehydrogenase